MEVLRATHTFKLLSGVEAEVREMTGEHQEILTKKIKGENASTRINKLLSKVLVRVGTNTNITMDFINNMLTQDRRFALSMARQFSMDFEEEFNYTFKLDSGGIHDEPVTIADGIFPHTPMPDQYEEYDQVVTEFETTLPKSNIRVKYNLLDGKGEAIGANIKKSDRSSNSLLKMRRIRYWEQPEGKDGMWISLNLNKIGIKDLAFLREEIKSKEGSVDSEIKFEHPEWESGGSDEQFIVIDLLTTINFFFPSGSV